MKKYISVLAAMALIVSAASCGGGGGSGSSNGTPFAVKGEENKEIAAEAAPVPAPSPSATGTRPESGYDEAYEYEPAAADGAYSDDSYYGDSFEEPYYTDAPESSYDYDKRDEHSANSQNRAGLLTAGEWRDNNNWPLWTSIVNQRYEWTREWRTWKLDSLLRYRVCVTANGTPYNGATVKLQRGGRVIWTAVSDSRGAVFLFDTKNDNPDKIVVEVGGKAVSEHAITDRERAIVGLEREPDEIKIDISANPVTKNKLDLMFVIDTTGSMSDELSYIQDELEDVIRRVSNDNNIDVRLSVNFYRDIGDEYVLRNFEFTDDISKAIRDLQAQKADGGGDTPEAVPNALEKAVFNHNWGKTDETEKLLFLVLDAPPHEKDKDMLPQIISGAAKTGIRIIPVASSGVDTATEFLCRTFAIMTGGTYTFLTDDSGIGNSHKEPTTGNYTVEKLNDMIVRIIGEYFTSEPYSAVSGNTTGLIKDEPKPEYSLRCDYFQTSDYYGGSGFYGRVDIRSKDDLYDFYDKYGYKEQLADFAGSVDFSRSYIAVEIICLSSGSVHIDSSHKFAAYDRNGVVEFDYELYTPFMGTDDMSAIFMMAEAPYASGTGMGAGTATYESAPRDEDIVEEEGLTDTEILEMRAVDDAIDEYMQSEDFQALATSDKAEVMLSLLNDLADSGTDRYPYPLIEKRTIYYDGRDMISFKYSCGVLGGVKLEPFDPMLN